VRWRIGLIELVFLQMGFNLRIAAYTGGERLPSARLRIRQYGATLRELGIDLVERPLPWESSAPKRKLPAGMWALGTVASRLKDIAASYGTDMTIIQRQMLPAFVPLEPLTRRPRVLDVDDAVWLTRGGRNVIDLARRCDSVICGNEFLAKYFRQWNSDVKVLPTAVDTEMLFPAPESFRARALIGWTGTSENYRFLYSIEGALSQVLRQNRDARLLVISDVPPQFTTIDKKYIEFVRWSPAAESDGLRRITVGIMPLEDSEWSRGKCSFKMLCYMASGVPVVVSPVGMNLEVLSRGDIGFGPHNSREWVEALNTLLRDSVAAAQMGANARALAMKHFSVKALGPRLAEALRSIARN
jgi:glycosyltransferase involved in cell wall biosynthesis